MTRHYAYLLATLLLSGAVIPACGAQDAADDLLDCNAICSRYQECFDSDYDVSACRSECEDNADGDSDYQARVDDCENCIDDESCTAAVFECTTECAGIVP